MRHGRKDILRLFCIDTLRWSWMPCWPFVLVHYLYHFQTSALIHRALPLLILAAPCAMHLACQAFGKCTTWPAMAPHLCPDALCKVGPAAHADSQFILFRHHILNNWQAMASALCQTCQHASKFNSMSIVCPEPCFVSIACSCFSRQHTPGLWWQMLEASCWKL